MAQPYRARHPPIQFHEAVAELLVVPRIRPPRSYLCSIAGDLANIIEQCAARSAVIPDFSPWERKFISTYWRGRAASRVGTGLLYNNRIHTDYGVKLPLYQYGFHMLGNDCAFVYARDTSYVFTPRGVSVFVGHYAGDYAGKIYQGENCDSCFYSRYQEVVRRSIEFVPTREGVQAVFGTGKLRYDHHVVLPCGLHIYRGHAGDARIMYNPVTGCRAEYATGRVATAAEIAEHGSVASALDVTEYRHIQHHTYNDFGDLNYDPAFSYGPWYYRRLH